MACCDAPTACFYAAAQLAPAQAAGAALAGVGAAVWTQDQATAGQHGVEEEGLEQAVKAAEDKFHAFHGINSFRGVCMRVVRDV